MNILIISEYFPPDQVGASTRVSILINELKKYHNITLITGSPHYPKPIKTTHKFLKPIKIFRSNNLKVIRIWMPEFDMHSTLGRLFDYFYFTIFFTLGLPFVTKKPDFIWATSPNVFCGFSAKIANLFFKSIPLVNVDDIWPEGPIDFGFIKNNFLKSLSEVLSNSSLKRIKIITTISNSISIYYFKKYHIPYIYMIPVGIEKERLQKLIHLREMKREVKNQQKEIIMMYSGKLGRGYDFKLMIQAFKIFQKRVNSRVKLIIRGTGPLESYISWLVKKSNIDNVILDTDYLTIEELNKKLMSADVFILPMQEGILSRTALPTKLFEYMSIGKPVIVCGKGEPSIFVEKARAGLCCYDRTPSALAETFYRFVSLKSEWRNWGDNGQEFIQENYSSDKIILKVNQMLEELESKFLK